MLGALKNLIEKMDIDGIDFVAMIMVAGGIVLVMKGFDGEVKAMIALVLGYYFGNRGPK